MKVFNNEKLSLHVEGGLTTRKFIRNMPGARFEYRFFTAEVPIMVNYELHKRWFVEGGLSASAYAAAIETENPDTRIGEGLRHYDFAALAGFQFLITDHFLLGARGRLGFLPMLEYTPIAASGEFGNTENDITLRNFEVYLRYRFTF